MFKKKKPFDWYEHLVEQSRTDHIYDLIHSGLSPRLEINGRRHFVLVKENDVPKKLLPLPEMHLQKHPHHFHGNDFLLLHNDHLTEYLEAAKAMKIVNDTEGNSFVQLVFNIPVQPQKNEAEKTIEAPLAPPAPSQALLYAAWEALKKFDHQAALEYAIQGYDLMSQEQQEMAQKNPDEYMRFALHYAFGYHIIATAYLCNNQFEKAFEMEGSFLHWAMVSRDMQELVESYLTVLIMKEQRQHLKEIFQDEKFREKFLSHYEAFMSLLVYPYYPLTRKWEAVNIINLVNQNKHHYK